MAIKHEFFYEKNEEKTNPFGLCFHGHAQAHTVFFWVCNHFDMYVIPFSMLTPLASMKLFSIPYL